MNIRFIRRWSCLLLVAVAALGFGHRVAIGAQAESSDSAAVSGEFKNVAVVGVAPWDKLIADVSYMGSLSGKPEAGQMLEGMASFFTQGKGTNAIDRKQPWGVIVQTDGSQFQIVGCLPVTKPDDLLNVATGYGATVKDGEGGTKEVTYQGRQIFVKVENNVAYLATSAESLARVPANSQQILKQLVGDYDMAAHVSVRNVPETYRQFAISAAKSGLQQGMKQNEGESDEAYAQREKMANAQMEQLERFVNDVDNVKLGLGVDAKEKRAHGDFTAVFAAGSKLAKQFAAYSKSETNFAGFIQPNAAAALNLSQQTDKPLSDEDVAQTEAMAASLRQQVDAFLVQKVDDVEAREALKGAFGDWIDALEETGKTGKVDMAATLDISADSLTFISGAHVKDPSKIESGFKKLEAVSQKHPGFPGIKWNAASHAGVAFSTISIPVPEGEDSPRKLLGEQMDVAIGIGPETAYLAIGKGNMDAVKKAIDGSAAEKNKKVMPGMLSLSLTPFLEVAATGAKSEKEKASLAQMIGFLRTEAQGTDHIRFTGEMVPNGMKYHFEAEEGVLKAMGKGAAAAAAAQQQRLGQ